jgi:hypothetical protein
MPFQNRVNPYGELCVNTARGMFMGNRGLLHNEHQQIVRPFKEIRWIICKLQFKNWHRPIMKKGQYTELFFMDEATALAAGHRPCAECQRERYLQYKEKWQIGNNKIIHKIGEIDAILHAERLSKIKPAFHIQDLPNGTLIEYNALPYLMHNEQIYEWTFEGYKSPIKLTQNPIIQLITPISTVNAIKSGFVPKYEI